MLLTRGPKLDQQATPVCITFWKSFALLIQNKKGTCSGLLLLKDATYESYNSLLTEEVWEVGIILPLFRNSFLPLLYFDSKENHILESSCCN